MAKKRHQGCHDEGQCWIWLRGYRRLDKSYDTFCIRRIITDKTEAHNWFRYFKTHYTNVIGTAGPLHFLPKS